ncbi:MAG: cytochrome c3 family protein, partial [Pseudobdellovibrionaceae bacterium]
MLPLLLGYQNCAKAPRVEQVAARSVSSASFSHSGTETECLSCHASDRPTNIDGFLSLNSKAPFDYATHGAGLDCLSCHSGMTTLVRVRSHWANGYYQHKDTLTSCSECHSTNRPEFTAAGTPHPNTGDCLTCHTAALASVKDLPKTRYTTLDLSLWKNTTGAAGFAHTGNETECLSCHAQGRPTSTAGFVGLNPKAPFDYTTHGAGLDCITCHSGMTPAVRTKADWANGYFMHKQTLQSCSECHTSTRPATTSAGSPHQIGRAS